MKMKKAAIALAVLAVALFAASCQKETEITPKEEGMSISAISEGISVGTKADLAYKYDVIWRTGDEICVKNSVKNVGFTLTSGEGTTKGIFSSSTSISGEVEGFYPASVANLIWPAEQQNNQVPPMYCKKILSSTQNQIFNFESLGSVLQLNFSATSGNIVLGSIRIEADEAMSGAFTIDNGQAIINQPQGDKPGITLDLGDEGVKVGLAAKKFNIAIPAGEYNNLTITFIAKDGRKCTKYTSKPQSIAYNCVNTLAISGEFKAGVPDGALDGVFTVANNGGTKTKVYFSRGNLYYDGSKFRFEAHQYDTPAEGPRSATHISHFHWSKSADAAVANDYSDSPSVSDVFFTNNTETTAKDGFTVNVGGTEQAGWRTLSKAEWEYLLKTRTVNGGTGPGHSYSNGITYCGQMGFVLYPDNYSGDVVSGSVGYLPDGVVFIPAAGDIGNSGVVSVGNRGYYWSSSPKGETDAYHISFSSSGQVSPEVDINRGSYCSVRLVTGAN